MISDVDYWLEQLHLRHWHIYLLGPDETQPELLVATMDWMGWATDVAAIHSEDHSIAWRAPLTGPDPNPFTPDAVTWWCEGPTNRTLRGILSLAPPGREQYPLPAVAAPPACQVPSEYARLLPPQVSAAAACPPAWPTPPGRSRP
ncbi:hypothetical protein [Actinophytocola sp.]|uniref:hypothetical protein n=1 Tax=Actinophytocola sp. TaxID=1872138 RepID=UPI002D7F2FE3|nr:hypothetical protein [Actinophytocola sp.]HET9139381.1 hypothetical protein [Actinophytocola sp.]